MKQLVKICAPIILLFTVGCQTPENNFQNDISEGPTPWSVTDFNNNEDQFTFAIISDLNGGEREGIFSVAVEQTNLFNPAFVLSVGDLIDGGTEDKAQLQKEWESFDDRASKLNAPFFHLGGNHDLTNVVMRDFWNDRYGPTYYHFRYKNILFLMMDSENYETKRMQEIYLARAKALAILDGDHPEDYQKSEYFAMDERNTGEISDAQNAYFEKVIDANPYVEWTFVLMHKPVWLRKTGRNLSRIETALANRKHTIINGHRHSYAHEVRNNSDYIMLGTTGGSQNAANAGAYDHITLVTMKKGQEPSWVNLKMAGILDKTGKIPVGGDSLQYEQVRK
jgi:predicted MPP superfamily phosphohydrolase